jgi:HAD superfamily hydrolase (TIGR01509 family)
LIENRAESVPADVELFARQSKIENRSSKIQLIVFDLGRVLLRISDDWSHAAALAGHPELRGLTGDLSTAETRGQDHALEQLLFDFETGRIETEAFFAAASATTGHPVEALRAVMDAVLIEAYPGIDELLDRLAPLDVKTACLSNTNARHWDLFTDPAHRAHLPLDKLDYAFASQQVGHAKPDAAIYGHVEAETGVAPPAILFFDDRPENIDAAAARGWDAVLVPTGPDPLPLLIETLTDREVLGP